MEFTEEDLKKLDKRLSDILTIVRYGMCTMPVEEARKMGITVDDDEIKYGCVKLFRLTSNEELFQAWESLGITSTIVKESWIMKEYYKIVKQTDTNSINNKKIRSLRKNQNVDNK